MFFYDFLSYRTTHYKVRTDISKKGQQIINLGHIFQTKDHTVFKVKTDISKYGTTEDKVRTDISKYRTTDDKFRTNFSKEGPEMIK